MMNKTILGLSLALLLAGCSAKEQQWLDVALKTGSALTLDESAEDELGQTVAITATNKWPVYDKPELNKYVTMVGLTLAESTKATNAKWLFCVLDTPDIGAYSGPNGYIMVTRGAIAAMQDESELAGVLAHEIAHCTNHDGLNAVKNAKLTEAAMSGVSAADQRMAQFNQASGHLVQTVLSSGWNQDQETKADQEAVKLLVKAGYDPRGLSRFLKRMADAKGGKGKPFGTHPGTLDRVYRTNAQVDAMGAVKAGATNTERFAKYAAAARL